MMLRKQIFCVIMIGSVNITWGMYRNNKLIAIETALSAPGTPVNFTSRLGGRPPLSPYSPRTLHTPRTPYSASRRGSLNGSPLDSELRKRLESFSPNSDGSPFRNRSHSCHIVEGSPISQATPPIPGSPTPHCRHNTVIEAQEPKMLTTLSREIHTANLYFGADCIDKSVDSYDRTPLGVIQWIIFLDEKKYAIASCDINYVNESAETDSVLIVEDFDNKLRNFVKNKMNDEQYIENK